MSKQQNRNNSQPVSIQASENESQDELNSQLETNASEVLETLEVIVENKIPTKVILKEKYRFEAPVVGRPDVFVTVNFKENQEVTDTHTIKHLIEANAPISIEN